MCHPLFLFQMEDECSIGNDETRIFILSSFASNKMNRVPCVLCKNVLHIFDRYPLLDGTFFLSPKQHTKSCIQVNNICPISWCMNIVRINDPTIKLFSNKFLSFSIVGQIRGQNQLFDSGVYVLLRRLDRWWHCVQILFEGMDWRSPNSWHNVLVRYICCHALLCGKVQGECF